MRFRACAYKRTPRRANQPELVFKKVESAQGCRDEGIGYCCRNNCVSVQIAGTDMSLFARLPLGEVEGSHPTKAPARFSQHNSSTAQMHYRLHVCT